jgi:hypothetical protein
VKTSDLHIATKFVIRNLEAFIWLAVIVYFAVSPVQFANHFTICPLSLAGFEHCPGCGLGRALVLLLHGKLAESISMHPLGVFALGLFIVRIVEVFRTYFNYQRKLKIAQKTTL